MWNEMGVHGMMWNDDVDSRGGGQVIWTDDLKPAVAASSAADMWTLVATLT